MHLTIQNNSGQKIDVLMRSLRYHYWGVSQKDNKWQFVRTLESGGAYPRVHIYLKYEGKTKESRCIRELWRTELNMKTARF